MSGIWFLWPSWWPALLLLPLLLAFGAMLSRRQQQRAARCFGPREVALLGVRQAQRLRSRLAVASAACLLVALLRPVTIGDEQRLGADVVLCVDVSRSMAARDVVPSRLAAAVAQIETLATNAHGSRLALLAFAGSAELVAPLSSDRQAIVQLATELTAGTRAGAGTNLAAAIELAQQVLQRGASPGSIVLLTDGEDFHGVAQVAARAANGRGVRVDCLGFGSERGSKIVVDDGGQEVFLQDVNGNEVVSRLDDESLRAVAAAGGGRFVRAVDAAALRTLHDAELVPAAAAEAVRSGRVEPVPCQRWPLLLALGLWMLRSVLPERRR